MKKTGNLSLIILMISGLAFASETQLSVSLDKSSVILGDAIRMTISVGNDSNPETPVLPEIEGFRQKFSGTRQQSFRSFTVVVQGKTVKQENEGGGYYFDYLLIPEQAGNYTIPSLDITYKNQVYKTQPFEIQVLDQSEKSDDIFLTVTSDKSELYLGESAEITFEWYFNKNISNYSVQIPWLDGKKGFLISDHPDYENLNQAMQINDGQQVLIEKAREVYKGSQYVVIRFKKTVTPIAPGTYDLEPAFLKCEVVTGYQRRQSSGSLFDDFFSSDFGGFGMGSRAVTESFATRSEGLSLNVKPLPEAGDTGSFSGGVGSFDFSLQTDTQSVQAGDPITVQMIISGDGNIDSIEAPKLSVDGPFKTYESESRREADPKTGQIRKVFEQVMIPREPGNFQLTAEAFRYFDTRLEKYRSIETESVQIQVSPNVGGNQYSAQDFSKEEMPDPLPKKKQDINVISEDIRYIKHSFSSDSKTSNNTAITTLLYIMLFGSLAASGAYSAFMVHRRRLDGNPALKRKSGAQKTLNESLLALEGGSSGMSDKEFAESLLKSISRYISDIYNQPPGRTMHELLETALIRGVDQESVHKFQNIQSVCESSMYGSSRLSADERHKMMSDVKQMLNELKESKS